MWGTLDEIPNSEEMVLLESTSRRKIGHQVEGWGCYATVKNSDPEIFLSKKTSAETKMEKKLREMWSSDMPNLESMSRERSKS